MTSAYAKRRGTNARSLVRGGAAVVRRGAALIRQLHGARWRWDTADHPHVRIVFAYGIPLYGARDMTSRLRKV